MRVIVIGAGVIGSAIALELRSRGAEVVLVEAHAEGGHTSAASAGMVNPFSLTPHDSPALPFYWRSRQMYPEWTRTLHEMTGIDPEWRDAGCLRMARDPADAEQLQRDLEWIRRYDSNAELIDARTACQMEPAIGPPYQSELALYLPSEGWVHTERLMRALHKAVQLSGVNFYTGYPVLSILGDAEHAYGIRTADGVNGIIEGDAVVVAAGAWTTPLLKPLGIYLRVEPVRGVIVKLGDLPVPVRRILSSPVGYLVPRADGTALMGATREQAGFEMRVTPQHYVLLLNALVRLAPALHSASVLGHTVGLRPDTPDHNPYIGTIRGYEGLYLATGHAYHGILLAPATARAVADLILHGATELPIQPLDPNRFLR
ncbi:MAG: glycine oxidase ThiO [Fimbriimonadales bacterium]|nr:glycine oxidase ThiO [Fimbriimonadales bacterium]